MKKYSNNLNLKKGIWYSRSKSKVYYPQDAYDKYFQLEEKSYWFIHRNNCIIETIKNFPPRGYLFDIGGGNGFVSYGLEKNRIQTYLVEPGIDAIRNAKKRKLKNLICASLEEADFHKNSIPAVGLFDVLEHIKYDDIFISKINDILVFGGRLYLTVPAFNTLWSGEDDYAGHFRRYTLNSIGDKLKAFNFKTEYATYIFSFLPIPILLFRSIPSRIFKKTAHNAEKTKKQFTKPKGIAGIVLKRICDKEIANIKMKKKIHLGSSCLLVAKKLK